MPGRRRSRPSVVDMGRSEDDETHRAPPVAEPAVVVVPAELDVQSGPFLRDATTLCFTMGAKRVELDMSGTTFVDSSGAGTLVGLARRARELGISLRARDVRPEALVALRMLGVENVIELTES